MENVAKSIVKPNKDGHTYGCKINRDKNIACNGDKIPLKHHIYTKNRYSGGKQ